MNHGNISSEGIVPTLDQPAMKNKIVRSQSSMIKIIGISVFLIMGANVFQFYPMLKLVREFWYVAAFLYCVIFVSLAQMLGRNIRVSGYEAYLLLVIVVMPVISAVSAKVEFDQPLIPGLLTHRNMATYGCGIAILYWIRTNTISLDDLRRALITAGWASFTLYLVMSFLMEPSQYAMARGFVGGGVVEPYQFIFKSPFIVFLVIYYTTCGFIRRSIVPLLYTLPLLFYLVFLDGGRSQFAALLIVLGLLFLKYLSIQRMLQLAVPFSLALALSIFLAYTYKTGEVEYQVEKFQAAISVVLTGEKSIDASANARLREIELAMPYIKDNIIFGNGQLSAQWKGGYFGNVGAFAPSDIGIWGLIFVFGIFGLAVFYGQFVFAWLTFRRQNRLISRELMEPSVFRIAVIAFIVFLFIDSLATGRVVFAGAVTFLFISILYTFEPRHKTQGQRTLKPGLLDG